MRRSEIRTSWICLWVMVLCAGANMSGAGCATQVASESTAQDETGAGSWQVSTSQDSTAENAAEALLPVSGTASLASCPPDPGRQVPASKEELFIGCMSSCLGAGHPRSGCWSGCCLTFTGCSVCYQP